MASVSRGATATYAQNALGQRVKKVTGGGNTTYFVYDEAGHLIGEYTGAGALIQETVWLGDIPVATLRPNGGSVDIFYVHTDHLNTPRRISRPADNVIVWRWDSDPFGTTVASQDPDGDSTNFVYQLRFPGQYYDAETGLNYNYFRDYDSQTGRYVESDPIGLKGGVNTYSYGLANSVMNIDPNGLLSCTYGIAARQLRCRNNGGQEIDISGDHVKSGQGACQDNPSCMAKENEGPLPAGDYWIHQPGYAPRRPTWLYLRPSKSNSMFGRSGFFIHRWGISNGCITVYFNSDFDKLSQWAVQDGGGDLHVSE